MTLTKPDAAPRFGSIRTLDWSTLGNSCQKQLSSPIAAHHCEPCAFLWTLSSTIPLLRAVGDRLDGNVLLPAALAVAVLRPPLWNIELIQRLFAFSTGYAEIE